MAAPDDRLELIWEQALRGVFTAVGHPMQPPGNDRAGTFQAGQEAAMLANSGPGLSVRIQQGLWSGVPRRGMSGRRFSLRWGGRRRCRKDDQQDR